MRKSKKVTLAKETLRVLEGQQLKEAGAGSDVNCSQPLIGQHTCNYSNCASCGSP
jgi:hypothetical protein